MPNEVAKVSSEKPPKPSHPEAAGAQLPQPFLAHHSRQPASAPPMDLLQLNHMLSSVIWEELFTHHLIWKLSWRNMAGEGCKSAPLGLFS